VFIAILYQIATHLQKVYVFVTIRRMSTFSYIIVFSALGGIVSLLGAALLLSRRNIANKLAYYATPFAAGALLAAVFMDLLKEGLESSVSADTVLYATLAGILLFFFAERFLRWFHHHHQDEGSDPTVPLIITGDTIHNALDGVAIAAAFMVSIPTGIVTAIAVGAHEIPQEIGDFGLLLRKGLSRKKVLLVNLLSALATVAAAIVTYWLGSAEHLPLGALLGLSAGFLLYIALSDIIPLIHEHNDHKRLFDIQALLLVVGVVVVSVSIATAHTFIDPDHDHSDSVKTHEVHEEEHEHQH
jgi:zinc and cadmium transporter